MEGEAEPRTRPLGAYGLRVGGIHAADLLVEADPAWPLVDLRASVAAPVPTTELVTDEHARLRLRSGGRIILDRVAGTAEFLVPSPLGDEELVHPYLAPVAAVMAHWHGRESFHAGGFAVEGGVWGVIGDRFAGKSTLLAWLALGGHAVVSDDLLVLERSSGRVFAGPRSVDLREEAAARLAAGEALGVVGARERWRLRLCGVDGSLSLRGWVFLTWGDRAEIGTIGGAARLSLLAQQRGVRLPGDPTALLDLASLPCLELRRPRRWDSLGTTAELLLEALAG